MNDDRLFNLVVCQTTEDLYQEAGQTVRLPGLTPDTVHKLIPIFLKCGKTIVIEPITV